MKRKTDDKVMNGNDENDFGFRSSQMACGHRHQGIGLLYAGTRTAWNTPFIQKHFSTKGYLLPMRQIV
jgi:hypothetical protein